jgi:hypothetical protein
MNLNTRLFFALCPLLIGSTTLTMNEQPMTMTQSQKLMQLCANAVPAEVYALVDTEFKPFTVTDRVLSKKETDDYNLPFRIAVHESRKPKIAHRDDVIQYVYPETGIVHDIITNCRFYTQRCTNNRCVGSFTIEGEDTCALYISLKHNQWFSLNAREEVKCVSQGMQPPYYTFLPSLNFGDKMPDDYEYCVDAKTITDDTGNGDNDIVYTARKDGAIFSYKHLPATDISGRTFDRQAVQPALSEEMLKTVYGHNWLCYDTLTVDAAINAMQFDHTRPDILFIQNNGFRDGQYAVLHRPTGYVEHGNSPFSDYDSKMKAAARPLLACTSPCRLRFLGDVGVKLVTVYSQMPSHEFFPIASIMAAAETFNRHVEAGVDEECTVERAELIINTFLNRVPNKFKRPFFFWYFRNADGTYPLKVLNEWLEEEESDAVNELTYGLL